MNMDENGGLVHWIIIEEIQFGEGGIVGKGNEKATCYSEQ